MAKSEFDIRTVLNRETKKAKKRKQESLRRLTWDYSGINHITPIDIKLESLDDIELQKEIFARMFVQDGVNLSIYTQNASKDRFPDYDLLLLLAKEYYKEVTRSIEIYYNNKILFPADDEFKQYLQNYIENLKAKS